MGLLDIHQLGNRLVYHYDRQRSKKEHEVSKKVSKARQMTPEEIWEKHEAQKKSIEYEMTIFCRCGHSKHDHPGVSTFWLREAPLIATAININIKCLGKVGGNSECCDCPVFLEIV